MSDGNTAASEGHGAAVAPTLYWGLGSTGREVLWQLRRRIVDMVAQSGDPGRWREQFPWHTFLVFDPWWEAFERRSNDADAIGFSDDEILASAFDLSAYAKIDRYPLIEQWMGRGRAQDRINGLMASLEQAPHHSSSQFHRPSWFWRLVFFHWFHRNRDQLRSKLMRLMDAHRSRSSSEAARTLGLQLCPERLRIVIVCALDCTEAVGWLLDAGWLAKVTASQYDSVSTDLVAILSRGSDQRNAALQYAALMQLETAMRGGFASEFLPNGWGHFDRWNLADKPFDHVYLVQEPKAVDRGSVRGERHWYQALADALFDDFVGLPDRYTEKAWLRTHQYRHTLPIYREVSGSVADNSGAFTFDRAEARFSSTFAQWRVGSTARPRDPDSHHTLTEEGTNNDPPPRYDLLPWLDLDWGDEGIGSPFGCQYWAVIFAPNANDDFVNRLPTEVKAALHENAGDRLANSVNVVWRPSDSSRTIYTEFSGFPLASLADLDVWREAYRRERSFADLHTHADVTLFVEPARPTAGELGILALDFRTFLLAVSIGVLTRNPKYDGSPPGQYRFEVAPGEQTNVGNERAYRMDGLPSQFRSRIVEAVEQRVVELSAQQCAALVGLFEHYADFTYRGKIIADDRGVETVQQGFASSIAALLSREFRDNAARKGASSSSDELDAWVAEAGNSLAKWTVEVEGSDADAYPWEVQPAADGPPRLKRVVKPDFFAAGWVIPGLRAGTLSTGHSAPGPALPGAMPGGGPTPLPPGAPPLPLTVAPTAQYWLFSQNQKWGPYTFAQLKPAFDGGQVVRGTLAWRDGLAQWVPIETLVEFAAPPLPDNAQ